MATRAFGWGVFGLACFAGCQLLSGGSDLRVSTATASSVTTSGAGAGQGGTAGDAGGDAGVGGGQGGQGGDGGQGGVAPCDDQGCPDGTQCVLADMCASGFCQDGVCCDEACDGTCESCLAMNTGSADGQCAPVPEGFDPDGECPVNNVCNDSGVCDSYCNVDPTPIQPNPCPSICTNCNSGICEIQCSSSTCQGPVNCPAGMDCMLFCNGTNTCSGLTLNCPETYHCAITCIGDNACTNSTINGTTGELDVVCGGRANSCNNMVVECGAGSCQIECTDQAVNNPPTVQENDSCGLAGNCSSQ